MEESPSSFLVLVHQNILFLSHCVSIFQVIRNLYGFRSDGEGVGRMEILAGQHRKQALQQCVQEQQQSMDECFWRLYNVYNITKILITIWLEITANIVGPKRPHTSVETFRDMYSLAPALAEADTLIVGPHLNPNRAPTAKGFLKASRKGEKIEVEKAFSNALSVCAAVRTSLDKYGTILATPMSAGLAKFCNTNVAIEIFTVNLAYEMSLSVCY